MGIEAAIGRDDVVVRPVAVVEVEAERGLLRVGEVDHHAVLAGLAAPHMAVIILVRPALALVAEQQHTALGRRKVDERVVAGAAAEVENALLAAHPAQVVDEHLAAVGAVDEAVAEQLEHVVVVRALDPLDIREGRRNRSLVLVVVVDFAGDRAATGHARDVERHGDAHAILVAGDAAEADHVVAVAAVDGVIAGRTADVVVATARQDGVVAVAGIDVVVEVAADDGIVAAPAFQVVGVVALAVIAAGHDGIVAVAAMQFAEAGVAALQVVAEIGAFDGFDAVEFIDIAMRVDRVPGPDQRRGDTFRPRRDGVARQVHDHAVGVRIVVAAEFLVIDDAVMTVAAIEGVVAPEAGEVVVVVAAIEQVGMGRADHDFDVGEGVGAGPVTHHRATAARGLGDGNAVFGFVVLEVVVFALAVAAAVDGVVAAPGAEEVVRAAAGHRVVAVAAVKLAFALAADQRVVAAIADELVEAVMALHVVVVVGALDVRDADQRVRVAKAVDGLATAHRLVAEPHIGDDLVIAQVYDDTAVAVLVVIVALFVVLDLVVLGTAIHRVVAGAAAEPVMAVAAGHRVVAAVAFHAVVAIAADERVVAASAAKPVVAASGDDGIFAVLAAQVIVAVAAEDGVVALLRLHRVSAVAGIERVVGVAEPEGAHAVDRVGVAERIAGRSAEDAFLRCARHVDDHTELRRTVAERAAMIVVVGVLFFLVVDDQHAAMGARIVGERVVAVAAGDDDAEVTIVGVLVLVAQVEIVAVCRRRCADCGREGIVAD